MVHICQCYHIVGLTNNPITLVDYSRKAISVHMYLSHIFRKQLQIFLPRWLVTPGCHVLILCTSLTLLILINLPADIPVKSFTVV